MKLLLDTNIIVDVLRKREEDYEASRLLLALGSLREFELWISPSQLGDIFYVLTAGGKKHLAQPVREELGAVLEFVRVVTFGDADARKALAAPFDDLEDALVSQAAASIRADFIITRNQDDFSGSPVAALSSTQFFEWLLENKCVRYADVLLPKIG